MTDVLAPYPSTLEAIADQTLETMVVVGGTTAEFYTAGNTLLGSFEVKNPASSFAKALKRAGAYDVGYRDYLVKGWHAAGRQNVRATSPGTLPGGTVWRSRFSPDGKYVAVATSFSPYLLIYSVATGVLVAGSVMTVPAGAVASLAWTPDGRFLAVGSSTGSPNYYLYGRSGSTLTLVSSNSTFIAPTPTASPTTLEWSPDGLTLYVGHGASPYHAVYKRASLTASIMGKLPDIALSTAFGTNSEARWSPDGQYLVVATTKYPYTFFYKRDGDTFNQLSNPNYTQAGLGSGTAWSYDGRYVAVTSSASPYLVVYERSGDIFTRVTSVANPGASGAGVEFTPDGRFLLAGITASPYLVIYEIKDGVFTQRDAPTMPGTVYDITFSPDAKYAAMGHAGSPFVSLMKGAMAPPAGAAVHINPEAVVVG